MTGAEARARYLAWLAQERRAAPHTVAAYGRDLRDFLGFLTTHLGEEPDTAALAGLHAADLRGFLAARATAGAGAAPRARQVAAIRGFLRHLGRAEGLPVPALGGLRGPRPKSPVPRALSPAQAKEVAAEIGSVHAMPRTE